MHHRFTDSTGQTVEVGDRVRWLGEEYTITGFRPGAGRFGTAALEFERPLHDANIVPDEIGIDRVGP